MRLAYTVCIKYIFKDMIDLWLPYSEEYKIAPISCKILNPNHQCQRQSDNKTNPLI